MKIIRNNCLVIFLISLLFFMGCSPTIPTNQAPTINSNPMTSTLVGQPYTYDVEATDADGDPLTYSLTSNPTGMTINSSTGVITWTPTMFGNYNVNLEVSDGDLSDTQSFTIGVSLPIAEMKPSPPTDVIASDSYDWGVEIIWYSVSGATHYQVYRASSLMGTRTPISGWNTENIYLDYNVTSGTTYWYWVKAATSSSGDNASEYSNYDTGHAKSPWEL
mgnify:CR=1 FL=1